MTEQPSHVRLDSASVKILAHPLRSRLVGALRNGGPATATALAGVLGTNSGATSYHLRKLEEVGLVVDTGEGVHRVPTIEITRLEALGVLGRSPMVGLPLASLEVQQLLLDASEERTGASPLPIDADTVLDHHSVLEDD